MRIRTAVSLIVILMGLIILTFFLDQGVSLIKFKGSFVSFVPELLAVALLIILAQVLIRLLRPLLGSLLRGFDQREALITFFRSY
jgi:hypothetical protein